MGVGFRTVDAPMREVMGAAEQSHPDELADIMADLNSNGVIIKYREGAMGYFPPALPGKPENIVMEKGAKREIDAYQVEIKIAKNYLKILEKK